MLRFCSACNEETLFVEETVYEGFTKVGSTWSCSQCGVVIEGEPPPVSQAKEDPLAALFGDTSLEASPKVFDGNENARFCRYCIHYVVNPFRQRCGLHDRDVEATDSCAQFEKAL